MRCTFHNFVDRTNGRSRLTHADIDTILWEAVQYASNLTQNRPAIVNTMLGLTDPCEVLELVLHPDLGTLITWCELYPGQDRPMGVLRLQRTHKGYRILELAGAMMSEAATGMQVLPFNPPFEFIIAQNVATVAQVLAATEHVYLPRDVANIIGQYARGLN